MFHDDDESVPFFVGCLAKTESNLENSNFCICVLCISLILFDTLGAACVIFLIRDYWCSCIDIYIHNLIHSIVASNSTSFFLYIFGIHNEQCYKREHARDNKSMQNARNANTQHVYNADGFSTVCCHIVRFR